MSANAPENSEARPSLPPHAPRVRLSAVHDAGTASCETTAPVILIGSRRDCHLALPYPDVSKIHSAVINTGRVILVRDLLSRTGTIINDQVIRTSMLKVGDRLRVGPVQVNVESLGQEHAPAEPAAEDPRHALRLATPLRFELVRDRVEMADNALVIGRRNTADLMIDTPDVSLAHALVFTLDGRPAICDLGSRSGTFVNGERIDLCWLAAGDELDIGGERLTVDWDEPHEAATPARPWPADSVAPEQIPEFQPAVFTPDAPGTLADLEESIAAVHTYISVARAGIDARALEFEERERELVRQAAELESHRHKLEQSEAELQQRSAQVENSEKTVQQKLTAAAERERAIEEQVAALAEERGALAQRHSALEQQQQALDQATQACAQEEKLLEKRAAELDRDTAQLAQGRATLQAEQAGLEAQQAACAAATAQLDQREAQIAPREAALEACERQLASREAILLQREAQGAEMLERIEQFRLALSQAGDLFASDAPSAAANTAPPSGPSPDDADTPPAAAAIEPQESEGSGDELPAPVVDEPLFSAEAGGPPADWPPELRERFRVLRRVSSKSDEELLTQVWADRQEVLTRPGDLTYPTGKKKRWGFWGN